MLKRIVCLKRFFNIVKNLARRNYCSTCGLKSFVRFPYNCSELLQHLMHRKLINLFILFRIIIRTPLTALECLIIERCALLTGIWSRQKVYSYGTMVTVWMRQLQNNSTIIKIQHNHSSHVSMKVSEQHTIA